MQNMLPIKGASGLVEQMNECIGKEMANKNRIVIGYCRVSSHNQNDDTRTYRGKKC